MKPIYVLLIDDDPTFVKHLTAQVEKLPFIQLKAVCDSYSTALAALREHQFDLILLDVFLEGADGLSGFDLLRHHQGLPPVIIISQAPENAVESYNIGKAKDFLVKPFENDRLLIAVNRALSRDLNPLLQNGSDASMIFLKMGRRYQRFKVDDIEYIEGYGIYTRLATIDGLHIVNESLTNFENLLDAKRFVRVHKSYIINVAKLEAFDTHKLYIKEVVIPIGNAYRSKIESMLKLFGNDVAELE